MTGMSARERIMAALRRGPVDRIPFVPLIDQYTLQEYPASLFPEGFRRYDLHAIIAMSRVLGVDLMVRHVPAVMPANMLAPHLQMMGCFGPPVEVLTGFDEEDALVETITTPGGSIVGRWKFTDKVGYIPHAVKHAVNDLKELRIFADACDCLMEDSWIDQFDKFRRYDAEIGEDGIATASITNSPFMYLIEMAWGLENTYYLLQDYPDLVEEILEKLHRSLLRYVERVAASPAEVVIQYENTSSTLISPEIFRAYCLPRLNEYGRVLRDAGKIFLVHMCGTLRAFVDDMQGGCFDGICDITPYPTGDLPLGEAARNLNGKIVIGGIDPNTFVCADRARVVADVSEIIRAVKPLRGVLLGSSDTTPRGTPIENFETIRELVNTLGSYADATDHG